MVNSNGIEATVLKAKCGSDIRKQHLHHRNDVNYNDLVLMMQRIFSISPNESIQLKYKDSGMNYLTRYILVLTASTADSTLRRRLD
jgi:hypothetical protein